MRDRLPGRARCHVPMQVLWHHRLSSQMPNVDGDRSYDGPRGDIGFVLVGR